MNVMAVTTTTKAMMVCEHCAGERAFVNRREGRIGGLTHKTYCAPAVGLMNENAEHAESDGQLDKHDTEGSQGNLCVLDMLEALVFLRNLDVVEVPASAIHDVSDEACHHRKRQ